MCLLSIVAQAATSKQMSINTLYPVPLKASWGGYTHIIPGYPGQYFFTIFQILQLDNYKIFKRSHLCKAMLIACANWLSPMSSSESKKKVKLFNELGVKVVSGQRFLAGYEGDRESTTKYIQQQV